MLILLSSCQEGKVLPVNQKIKDQDQDSLIEADQAPLSWNGFGAIKTQLTWLGTDIGLQLTTIFTISLSDIMNPSVILCSNPLLFKRYFTSSDIKKDFLLIPLTSLTLGRDEIWPNLSSALQTQVNAGEVPRSMKRFVDVQTYLNPCFPFGPELTASFLSVRSEISWTRSYYAPLTKGFLPVVTLLISESQRVLPLRSLTPGVGCRARCVGCSLLKELLSDRCNTSPGSCGKRGRN